MDPGTPEDVRPNGSERGSGRPAADPTRLRGPRGRRHRDERGASMVEYALLAALLVVPTAGAIEFVQNSADAKVTETAADISDRTIPPATAPSTSGPSSTTTTTTTTTTTPTTTAAPTTTPTTPPTTAPATQSSSSWGVPTTRSESAGQGWAVDQPVTVRDDNGQPVAGAQVTIDVFYDDGGWQYGATVTATTDAAGAIVVDSGVYGTDPDGSLPYAARLRFDVVSVDAPGLDWDGADASTVVDQ